MSRNEKNLLVLMGIGFACGILAIIEKISPKAPTVYIKVEKVNLIPNNGEVSESVKEFVKRRRQRAAGRTARLETRADI